MLKISLATSGSQITREADDFIRIRLDNRVKISRSLETKQVYIFLFFRCVLIFGVAWIGFSVGAKPS